MTTNRPRTVGLNLRRRQSFRAYYEPFTPTVVEVEANEAHVLLLELLDFNGEQVRVEIEEGARTVRVTGDRSMGNNRVIRLDKTYPIPQNCVIEKINHIFDNGILTVTMPKQSPSPPAAGTAAKVDAPPPKEADQPTPDKATETTSQENENRPDPIPDTKTEDPEDETEQPITEKGQGATPHEVETRPDPKPETKNVDSEKEAAQPITEKGKEDVSREDATRPESETKDQEKEGEQPIAEKGNEAASKEDETRPDTKPETKEPEMIVYHLRPWNLVGKADRVVRRLTNFSLKSFHMKKGEEETDKPITEKGQGATPHDVETRPDPKLDTKTMDLEKEAAQPQPITEKGKEDTSQEDATRPESKTEDPEKKIEKPITEKGKEAASKEDETRPVTKPKTKEPGKAFSRIDSNASKATDNDKEAPEIEPVPSPSSKAEWVRKGETAFKLKGMVMAVVIATACFAYAYYQLPSNLKS